MPGGSGSDNKKVERVLALGYAEAQQRTLQRAKLDALLEATVAVCDLFPPSKLNGEQFYLSDVELICKGQESRPSSLAPFDRDVREQLENEKWFGARGLRKINGGIQLRIPKSADAASGALVAFWKEFLEKPGMNGTIAGYQNHVSANSVLVEEKIWADFDDSLRYAFDAVTRDDPQHIYTLRIDRRRPSGQNYPVCNGYEVPYVMGYWLSAGMLLHLQDKQDFTPTEVKDLQDPWTPSDGAPCRTQSHTNVETRLAGVVRNQTARTQFIRRKKKNRLSKLEKLERKAWGDPPETILMVPLTNAALINEEQRLRTLAHLYLPIKRKSGPAECLLARRYRLSLLFTEALYEEYCRTLGHELAYTILESWGATGIEQHCDQIAAAFRASPLITCQEFKGTGENLLKRIDSLKKKGLLEFDPDEWGQDTALLGNISLTFQDQRLELDVLPRLLDHFGTIVARKESSQRLSAQVLRQHIDEVQKAASTIQGVLGEARRQLLRNERVAFSRLTALSQYFVETGSCAGKSRADRVPHGDWSFRPGHVIDNCPECRSELTNRIGCLFGGRPGTNGQTDWSGSDGGETAAQKLATICSNDPQTQWGVLKCACHKSSRRRPTIAAIVVLLLNAGVDLDTGDAQKKFFTTTAYTKELGLEHFKNWEMSLEGIVNLSKWIKPGDWPGADGNSAIVRLEHKDSKLCFTLDGQDMWYPKWLPCKPSLLARTPSDKDWKHDRTLHVAAAFAHRRSDGPLRIEDKAVALENEATDSPVWVWRLGK